MRALFCIRNIMILTIFTLIAATSQAAKYSGNWDVSRGAGGRIDLEITGTTLTGNVVDTGWERLTGERRTGTIAGTTTGKRFRLTIKYSTGATSTFEGNIDKSSDEVSMTGLRYLDNKPVKDTRFTASLSLRGSQEADITGLWHGSFTYGPNRGYATVRVQADNSFSGRMESTRGEEWTMSGSFDRKSDKITIRVDSGASEQTYWGTYTQNSDGSVNIKFDKDTGPFAAVMKRA